MLEEKASSCSMVFIFSIEMETTSFMQWKMTKYIRESSPLLECTREDAEIIKKMHYKNTNQFVYT